MFAHGAAEIMGILRKRERKILMMRERMRYGGEEQGLWIERDTGEIVGRYEGVRGG